MFINIIFITLSDPLNLKGSNYFLGDRAWISSGIEGTMGVALEVVYIKRTNKTNYSFQFLDAVFLMFPFRIICRSQQCDCSKSFTKTEVFVFHFFFYFNYLNVVYLLVSLRFYD